jgi:hypothetical protein
VNRARTRITLRIEAERDRGANLYQHSLVRERSLRRRSKQEQEPEEEDLHQIFTIEGSEKEE